MQIRNFWNELPRPIVGLSPMDGVTDAAFRRIVARHGKPDLTITEFTSAEGICHGAESELSGLIFDEVERPVVAQIYGADPDAFFHVAQLVCKLGFDGLDINMGCPAKAVSSRGCGAGLIQNPTLAKEILRAARRGIARWADGAPLSIFDLQPQIADWIRNRGRGEEDTNGARANHARRPIPVSVKTRLGTNRIVIKEWIPSLLEESPAAIAIHGRTLAQRYRGAANWEAIAEAVEAARGSETLIIGNGDISSLDEARRRVEESGVDGVLIGRAALGNPWIFRNKEILKTGSGAGGRGPGKIEEGPIRLSERLEVALEHARLFQEMRGLSRFAGMRKHLGWYCRGFQGASELRAKMVQVRSAEEAEALLAPFLFERSFIESST